MTKLFVGIDVSKDTLDVAVLSSESKEIIEQFIVDNSKSGINHLLKQLRKLADPDQAWICFEHTGAYCMLLRIMLDKKELCYSVVPALQIKRSMGMVRGSNDKIDAKRIAFYAMRFQDQLPKSKLPPEELIELSMLWAQRNHLVRNRTSHKNRLKVLRSQPKTDRIKKQVNQEKEMIEIYDDRVKDCEAEMETVISERQELQTNYQLIQSIKGIGPITATLLLVTTENFTRFSGNARKFNCYAGLAPFSKQSGTSVQTQHQVSTLRNKSIKTLLYSCAHSAIRFNKEMKTYADRKLKEGKYKQKVVNAVAAKLISRVFAIIRRQSPFTNIYQQNFQQHLEVSQS